MFVLEAQPVFLPVKLMKEPEEELTARSSTHLLTHPQHSLAQYCTMESSFHM